MSATLACDLSALDAIQREQHSVTSQTVFASVLAVEEHPDGYAFRLPVEMLLTAAAFIENERRCCPFFQFDLRVESLNAALWITLGGSAEIKQFIGLELSDLFKAAG